jgi:hypothetical protein
MSSFHNRLQGLPTWIGTGVAIVVVAFVGWVGDDAFISMRVLDNAVNGFGLRWQAGRHGGALTGLGPARFCLAAGFTSGESCGPAATSCPGVSLPFRSSPRSP